MLEPSKLTLLHGSSRHLGGFFQELAHHAIHELEGNVLWVDGDHGFNPYDFAELNLIRGHQADHGGTRMLIKRCMTPFQWYTALDRLLPEKIEAAKTAVAFVNPFDRLWSTDELADWEQEDYVRFIVPRLKDLARDSGVPVVIGVDLERWWRTHPVLSQVTKEGVDVRWSVTERAERWRLVRDDGLVLDPELRRKVTLLDFVTAEERPILEAAAPRRRVGIRVPHKTRIVHPEVPNTL